MKETKKKGSVFAKKSVFVTLVGLVAIVVISLTMNLAVQKEKANAFDESAWEEALKQSVTETETIYQEEAQTVTAPVQPEVVEEQTEEETPEKTTETVAETPEPVKTESQVILLEKPVQGGITKDYSAEELIYSDTMQDWRVHEGIDFGAEEKTEVKAVADGTVEEVSQDGLFGACLILSHPDGIQTFYGNLEEDSMPAVGTQVKTGETIGKVGKTATVEINDKPHLHFEVRKDGKSVNPHDFMGDTVTEEE